MLKRYPEAVDGLVVARDGAVLRLRIDRPDRRNSLTDDIVLAMTDAIEAAGGDEEVRVIALSASGDHFCSGFDLGTRGGGDKPRTGATQRQMRWHVNRLVPTMLETQTPIVTAATGWVVGLGLHVVLASDFAVVADDARLWAPFTTLAFTPDSGGSWLIPRLVGVARAKELLMLGRRFSGADAAAWGMLHRAVPAADVASTAAGLVEELASAATVAVGLTKLLVQRGLAADLEHHLADEAFAMEVASRSEDFHENVQAKREKRAPEYRGR